MTKDRTTTLSFAFERETPGAVRYQEVDSDGRPRKTDVSGAHVGTLYVRKWALNGSVPKKLEVTITGR